MRTVGSGMTVGSGRTGYLGRVVRCKEEEKSEEDESGQAAVLVHSPADYHCRNNYHQQSRCHYEHPTRQGRQRQRERGMAALRCNGINDGQVLISRGQGMGFLPSSMTKSETVSL